MRIFLAAIVIASLAGPAFAQSAAIPKYGELEGKPHEIAAEKEAERAYQKSLGRIPEQKGSSRPVGLRPMRSGLIRPRRPRRWRRIRRRSGPKLMPRLMPRSMARRDSA